MWLHICLFFKEENKAGKMAKCSKKTKDTRVWYESGFSQPSALESERQGACLVGGMSRN